MRRLSPDAQFNVKVLHETEPHLSDKNSIIIRSFDAAARRLELPMKYRPLAETQWQRICFSPASHRSCTIPATTSWHMCPTNSSKLTSGFGSVLYAETLRPISSADWIADVPARCAASTLPQPAFHYLGLNDLRTVLRLFLPTALPAISGSEPRRQSTARSARRWTPATLSVPKLGARTSGQRSGRVRSKQLRLSARRGLPSVAAREPKLTSLYLGLLSRNSVLAPYALWHLSRRPLDSRVTSHSNANTSID